MNLYTEVKGTYGSGWADTAAEPTTPLTIPAVYKQQQATTLSLPPTSMLGASHNSLYPQCMTLPRINH